MASSIRELSPELQEKACKELNEVPARREQDLAHIKEWLKKQPHINAITNDQWIVSFLRGSKFSLERTKQKLDTYYTMRTILPEFFSNRDPMLPEIQEILKLGVTLPMATVDSQGRRVTLHRLGIYDPAKISIVNVMKVSFMIGDIILLEDETPIIAGGCDVMDMAHVTLGHAGQITPTFAKKTVTCVQEAYPFRTKGLHYINTPPMFDSVLNLFKIVLKEKLKKRINMHGDNMESLYKHIAQCVLPVEYGGQAGTIQDLTAQWKAKVESYRDFFIEGEKYKTDEKKRPGKPKTHEALFGVDGSFRQLTVD